MFHVSRRAFALGLFALALSAAPVLAGKAVAVKPAKVAGVITAVNPTARTVTIRSGTSVVTLTVAGTAKIEVNDKEPATFADVVAAFNAASRTPGQVLKGSAEYDAKTRIASKLNAEQQNEGRVSGGR